MVFRIGITAVEDQGPLELVGFLSRERVPEQSVSPGIASSGDDSRFLFLKPENDRDRRFFSHIVANSEQPLFRATALEHLFREILEQVEKALYGIGSQQIMQQCQCDILA